MSVGDPLRLNLIAEFRFGISVVRGEFQAIVGGGELAAVAGTTTNGLVQDAASEKIGRGEIGVLRGVDQQLCEESYDHE